MDIAVYVTVLQVVVMPSPCLVKLLFDWLVLHLLLLQARGFQLHVSPLFLHFVV